MVYVVSKRIDQSINPDCTSSAKKMIVYVWTVKKHGLDVDNKKGRLEREREQMWTVKRRATA